MATPAEYALAADLVNRIRDGDSEGAAELYSTLSGAAMPRLSRTVDYQLVEDKFHDIVVTVLEAIQDGSLREPSRLMGFARTVTRRGVAAHIRHKITQRRRVVQMGPGEFATPSATSPERASIERERLDVLRTALRNLQPRDREILARFYLDEQAPQKICSEMGLTTTQFRLYKSRAVARCSKYVQRGVAVTEHNPSPS